mmetsp:Transcript_352/g.1071  ORF Transcript_352/g.1071 Transcript_352/m.1071 type:complete len:385 (-) Transcript_352:819-1973(-)
MAGTQTIVVTATSAEDPPPRPREWAFDHLPTITCFSRTYTWVPPTCSDRCEEETCNFFKCFCCCCSCLADCCGDMHTFMAPGKPRVNYRGPGCCQQWYHVDGMQQGFEGSMKVAGPCDNGCAHYWCWPCVCRDVDLIYFKDANHDLRAVVRRDNKRFALEQCCLFTFELCICVVSFIDPITYSACRCAERCFYWCNQCCVDMSDWCNFCGGNNMITFKESVFDPRVEGREVIGDIEVTYGVNCVFDPCTACCAVTSGKCPCCGYLVERYPVRVSVAVDDQSLVYPVSLYPAHAVGIVSSKSTGCTRHCCCMSTFRGLAGPTGDVACCNRGRFVTTRYSTFQRMLDATEPGRGGVVTVTEQASITEEKSDAMDDGVVSSQPKADL